MTRWRTRTPSLERMQQNAVSNGEYGKTAMNAATGGMRDL